VVLATSLPLSSLLSQRAQLASTARQVGSLEAQNKSLEGEAQQLSNPSTVAGIARRDYGLVAPGSKAYEILPTSGATGASQSSGHVPLDEPPVVPGSTLSQELLGAGTGAESGPASGGAASTSGHSSGAAGSNNRTNGSKSTSTHTPSGFWTRVVHTLEFWR